MKWVGKRKFLLLYAAVLIAVALGGAAFWDFIRGARPFRGLRADQIQKVTMFSGPPAETVTLTPEEIQELLPILREITFYELDGGYLAASGEAATFIITRTDGSRTKFTALAPYFILDGDGYQAKAEPCKELNDFAKRLCAEKNP